MKKLTKLAPRYKFILFCALMLGTACGIFLSGLRIPTILALMVLLCAVSADFITTYLALKAGGKEGNPVIAFLMRKITVWGTFALMAGIWTVFILLRWLPSDISSQTAIAITYWLVPINNVMVLRGLRKKMSVKEA